MTPVEFRRNLWRQEARVPGLSCGVVCVILSLAILVEHRLVTRALRRRQYFGGGAPGDFFGGGGVSKITAAAAAPA